MSNLRDAYYTDVHPVLMKNRVNRQTRSAMFEIIKRRHAGIDLSASERKIDIMMLRMGIDSYKFIPISLRRNWQEQPD